MNSETQEKILAIYKRGDSIEYICKKFDLTKSQVNRFLYITAKVERRNKEFRMNDFVAVKTLRAGGMKIKTITETLGIKKDQVHYVLFKVKKGV